MKKQTKCGIAVGSTIALILMLTFWLGGYDYTHRGEHVAAGFLITTILSITSTIAVATWPCRESEK